MNNCNGRNNVNIFGTGFSLRRFLLETAPSFIEHSNRSRNFDIERGQIESTRRERKNNCGEESYYSKPNRKNSLDSSKVPLTENTSTIENSNPSKTKHKTNVNLDTNKIINPSGSKIKSSPGSSSTSSSSSSSWNENNDNKKENTKWFVESNFCPICYLIPVQPNKFKELSLCKHETCHRCLERYVRHEILEFRTSIACPQCSELILPNDIEMILNYDKEIITKYEDYMVRKYLLADPDSRWCPAPDCGYAVIAAGCASCPRIRCQRTGCGLLFCYHCKAEWHPDQTCDVARTIRQQQLNHYNRHQCGTENASNQNTELQLYSDDVKPCPRCHVLIYKMDDGSCNHMVCSICSSEFCWLCMKEISDLHYLSPSGCTFWGKKPWSRKKKIMWQIGTLIGAPVGIALIAGIAVPAMIIGIPVWIGKKIYVKYFKETRLKRNLAVMTSVLVSFVMSPILAGLTVAIGVPILLFYVYGVVPISLCRTSFNVTTSGDGLQRNIDEANEADSFFAINADNENSDQKLLKNCESIIETGSASRSIDDVSISVGSASNIGGDRISNASDKKYDQDSTIALAGSIIDI